jgi:xanthine dehydrogenase iron-sulfur cluster and FAD-binding subunit A
LQEAMIAEQAVQCGYCYNGQIIKGAELLFKNPRPTEAQIRAAMNGHICRCGTYPRILSAIQRASKAIAADSQHGAPPHTPARSLAGFPSPRFAPSRTAESEVTRG